MRFATFSATTFATAAVAAALLVGCTRDRHHDMCGGGMGMRGMNNMNGMQGAQNNAALQAQPAQDQRVSPSQQVAPATFSTAPAQSVLDNRTAPPLGSCSGR